MNNSPIVIDNGSLYVKCGFAGEERPRSTFLNAVGYPKFSPEDVGGEKCYVGDEVIPLYDHLKIVEPIYWRNIEDWTAMERVWHHAFNIELGVDPSSHPVLITQPCLNPLPDVEKMAKIMFEKFNVPALYIGDRDMLALLATGRVTGVVVGLGHGSSRITPIYESFNITHSIHTFFISGSHIEDYLGRLIRQRGPYLLKSSYKKTRRVREIKEESCYISTEPDKEVMLARTIGGSDIEIALLDGETVQIGIERFLAPECLFQPSAVGASEYPLHESVIDAIQRAGIDLRKEHYKNIVLAGGTSCFPGLKERLTKEIKSMVPEGIEVEIIAHPERQYLSWLGGSIMASNEGIFKALERNWVTREEYLRVEGPKWKLFF